MANQSRALDATKRKRAKYVAGTLGLILNQHKNLHPDSPLVLISTKGQVRFIREMLNKVAQR